MHLSEPARRRLLDAWEAWDKRPSAYAQAELSDAETAAAAELRVSPLVLGSALRAGRRAGLDYSATLDQALDQLNES